VNAGYERLLWGVALFFPVPAPGRIASQRNKTGDLKKTTTWIKIQDEIHA
jgi:hypothetical protein